MYEIKLNVRANGTLEIGLHGRLRLGTTDENQRTKLTFEIDTLVEVAYHYLKLTNGNLSCLYRIRSSSFVLNKTIISKDGIWLTSFISTNEVISNEKMSGSYVFITEPIEAIVIKGITGINTGSEELDILKSIVDMTFSIIKIPENVESIGPYFLYNSKKTFELEIGPDVKTIGSYAFYGATTNTSRFSS